MNKRHLDRAFRLVGQELEDWARQRYHELCRKITPLPRSQIEEMLIIGMVGMNVFKPFFEFDGAESFMPRFGHALVKLQRQIGPYRVDFLIDARVGDKLAGQIVVECDGRYHDEPAQIRKDAVRNRFMEDKGYLVLRFGGSEIWKNPMTPVLEIVNACENLFRIAVAQSVGNPVSTDPDEIDQQPLTGDPPELHRHNAELLRREDWKQTP